MIDNPFTQDSKYFNNALAYAYLNPELNQTITEILTQVKLNQIDVSDIKQNQFPENFNTQLFVSQNINEINIYQLNNHITQSAITNNALFNHMYSYIPVFQHKLLILDDNFFQLVNGTLNANHINYDSIIKIKTSHGQVILGKVVYIDFDNNMFQILTEDYDTIIPTNETTYTLHSVQIYDVTRLAYIVYYREYLTQNPNIIYDTQIEFNYELYKSLYPESKYMTKEEAYLDYIYFIGINNNRIAKASDILINDSNIPTLIPLDPLAQGDIDTNVVRVRQVLNVPENGIVSFHGIDLYYTSSNNIRHSRDVRYTGLITEHAIKSYVDHKFDNYADINDINVIGQAVFNSNVQFKGESNIFTNIIAENLNVKESATLQSIETIKDIIVNKDAIINSNTYIKMNLFVDSNVEIGGNVNINNDVLLNSNLIIKNNTQTQNIHVENNVTIEGTIHLDSNIIISKSNIVLNNLDTNVSQSKIDINNTDVNINNCNINLSNNKINLSDCEVNISSSIINVNDINIVNELNTNHLNVQGNSSFTGSNNKTVFEHYVEFENNILANNGINIKNNNMTITDNDVIVNNGNVLINQGNIEIEEGSIYVNQGNITINNSNIIIDNGSFTINNGDIYIPNGKLQIDDNTFDQNGIILDGASLNIIDGYFDINSKFIVQNDSIETILPITIHNSLSIENSKLILDNTNIEITSNNNIIAYNTNCHFNECFTKNINSSNISVSQNINGKEIHSINTTSCNLATNKLNVYNILEADSSNVWIKKQLTIDCNVQIKEDILVNGEMNVTKFIETSELMTNKLTTSNISINGLSEFNNNVICNKNLDVNGRTFFYGNVQFRNPLYFNSITHFNDEIKCSSNVTFLSTCKFSKNTTFETSATFNSNIIVKGNATFETGGVIINNDGVTIDNKTTIGSAYIYSLENTNFECKGSALFNDIVTFKKLVKFTSNTTFIEDVNMMKNLNLNKLNIGTNIIASDSMTLFKKNVYVDTVIISSNITIQNQGYIKYLIADTLETTKFIFSGELLDIRKDLTVRNNTLLNTCTIEKNLITNGSINVFNNSVFKNDLEIYKSVSSCNIITSNIDISNTTNLNGVININGKCFINNDIQIKNNAICFQNVEFNRGFVVKTEKTKFEQGATVEFGGKVSMSNLYVQSLNASNISTFDIIHVNKSASFNADLTVDGSISIYNAYLRNDISECKNIYASELVKCKNLFVMENINIGKELSVKSLNIPNIMSTNNSNIEFNIPLIANKITANDICTFNKGITVNYGMNVNTKPIFNNHCDFKETVTFYKDTTFNENSKFYKDVTVYKNLYVDGSLFLSQDVNLQRDITVNNLKAMSNIYVLNQTNSYNAVIQNELKVPGLSHLNKIGIGKVNNTFLTSNVGTGNILNITCDELIVKENSIFKKDVKIQGTLEAQKIVQLSDKRSKFNILNVTNDELYNAIECAKLKYYTRITDRSNAIGFMAQDFENNNLLKQAIVLDGETKYIQLTKTRYFRNISSNRNIIQVSDGFEWIFDEGQTLVLNDGRKYTITNCNQELLQANISPQLDITDECISVVGLQINDTKKIDHTQMNLITLGMCSALLDRIKLLEEKLYNTNIN